MEFAIKINGLKKNFDSVEAVKGINLDVKPGEMFGLVGPDGAGKTTIIRILCGLLSADSGKVQILGMDLSTNKKKIKNEIGYLSQKFSLYGDLTIDENIEFFADIHGVKNYKPRRDELLEFTRLKPFKSRLAERLSGGMKQKLALACTLIHKPKIIFLDEPTTGVDPVSRRDFWTILANLLKEGITIFMSTPYLDEAERCNRVALMHNGEIISFDSPQVIKGSIKRQIIEIVCSPVRNAYNIIKGNTEYKVQMFGDRLHIVSEDHEKDYKKLSSLLSENNIPITDYRVIPPSLENVFIYLISNS